MIVAHLPVNEQERLAALQRYGILDTSSEERFEVFPQLVVQAIGVPSAVISFVDSERQWFKARINIADQETSRDIAFCAHAIHCDRPMVVTDATKDPRFFDNPLVTSDGGVRFYAGAPIRTADGYAIGVLCAIDSSPRDLSADESATLQNLAGLVANQLELRLTNRRLVAELAERERAEQRWREASEGLAQSNLHFDAALNNILHGLCMINADEKLVVSNARFAEIYGLTAEETKPGTPTQKIEAACLERGTFATGSLTGPSTSEPELHALEDSRVVSVRRQQLPNGGWMTTHEDITERHHSEGKLAYMARHDLLTGLLNRASFSERIQEAEARLRRWGELFSVVLLDLDRFKHVNDTLGHPAGDVLLREAAVRLQGCVRETDVLARFGGDEFAVMLTRAGEQREEAIAFANRIVRSFIDPFEIAGQKLTISASLGITFAPGHGADAEELIKNADLALYQAKARGRNGYAIFDSEMMDLANARQRLEHDLRQAIANEELELYYQPQIETMSGEISGVEALLRWRHPEKGFISPGDFIPIAEETGLIERLGEWVLHTACAQATQWPAEIKVAVNLSPVQFRHAGLLNTVLYALVESGLDPRRLEVEITESVLLESKFDNLTTIRQLRNLGVSVALDDFGTGYSSFNYLTMFPFDKIKIDKFFSMNLLNRSDCAAIIASVITLGHGLGIPTLAEGVEPSQQFDRLRAAGVDFCQGFLLGRPVPASELDFKLSYAPCEPKVA
jgi:diguanylate cyclase (GGDEF)-like protein